jgi:hypothetical protein
VIVAFALHIATVESELQRHRQAVHHSSVDQSLGEGVLGIPERLLTLGIGLPTGALRVEDDWMDIDLACAVRNECNATRSPVRLHRVTMPAERLQQVFERHLGDIDGEIEVAVDPGLTPNKCVDTPSAGNPNAVIPCPVSDTQHSPDIASGHVPASVSPMSVTMRLAKQVRNCPAPVGLGLRDRAATRRIFEVTRQQAETAALHVGPDIGSPLRT